MHTLLDLHGNIPTFIRITSGKVHDVNILDEFFPETGSFYVMECEVCKNVEWARQGPENCGLLGFPTPHFLVVKETPTNRELCGLCSTVCAIGEELV
jgi:hypothetical protein